MTFYMFFSDHTFLSVLYCVFYIQRQEKSMPNKLQSIPMSWMAWIMIICHINIFLAFEVPICAMHWIPFLLKLLKRAQAQGKAPDTLP